MTESEGESMAGRKSHRGHSGPPAAGSPAPLPLPACRKRPSAPICLCCVLLCCFIPAALAQNAPLRSDDPSLLEIGRVRFSGGFEFLQKQRYSLSGLEGDLTRAGVSALQVGLGEYAEFQMHWVAREFLAVSRRGPAVVAPDFAGNATSDFGNLLLATKLKLAGEKGPRPALAFKFAVELPNTSRASGLGKDEMDFYGGLVFRKSVGRAALLGQIGLGILGNPVQVGRQADVLTYGTALLLPIRRPVTLVAEWTGRRGPSPQRAGNENRAQARVGVQIRTRDVRWDIGAIAGLESLDPDSGISIGVTYEFKAFHK